MNEINNDAEGEGLEKNKEIDDIDIDVTKEAGKSGDKKQDTAEKKPQDEIKPGQSIEEMKEEYENLTQNKRGRKLDDEVMVKICDMGNGCWTHHHFTPEI